MTERLTKNVLSKLFGGLDTTSIAFVEARAFGCSDAVLVWVVPGIMVGLAGIGGSVIGTRLNHAVDPNVLLLAFAGLMLIAAWPMSAVALAGRVGTTTVDWAFAAPFTIAALLGVSVGKNIADRLPTVILVRWFVGLLVVLAAYVCIRVGLGLASP